MDLFELNNRRAFPSVHALLIEPFKTIWEQDNTEDKHEAVKAFSYIELVCSPKKSNPYFGYAEEERPTRVKREVWGDNPPDDPGLIMAAIMKYKELLLDASPTYSLFIASLTAAKNLENNLLEVNLDERTQSGAAVTKPKDVTSALKEIPDVMRSLEAMRNKVHSELLEDAKTRGDRKIGLFERPEGGS